MLACCTVIHIASLTALIPVKIELIRESLTVLFPTHN